MKLEQSIQRSSKSEGGIVTNTKSDDRRRVAVNIP